MLGAESEARLLDMEMGEFFEVLEDARAIDALRLHERFEASLAAARGNERHIHAVSNRLLRKGRVRLEDLPMGDVDELIRDMGRD